VSPMVYVCHLYGAGVSAPFLTTVSGQTLLEVRAACRTLMDSRPGSTLSHLYLGAERMETIHAA